MKKFILLIASVLFSVASFAIGPIIGPAGACAGSCVTLTDTTLGGTWSTSSTVIATIGSTGTICGVAAGTVTVTYNVGGVYVTTAFSFSLTPGAIFNAGHVCLGSTTTVSDAVPGGTWSSSAPAYGSINAVTGVVTGVATGGTFNITYQTGPGCSITAAGDTTIGIPVVDTVSGPTTVCAGATITMTDLTGGGAWSSSNTSIATVSSGVVSGVSGGPANISYTVTNVCGSAFSFDTILVLTSPRPDTIRGPSHICLGSTITLSDTTPGGVWSSSDTTVAIVSGGVATGLSLGTAEISYGLSGICGMAYAVGGLVTVVSSLSAGAISGPADTVGGNVAFTDIGGTPGGVWTSSNTAIATVNGSTGVVTGIALGTAVITYSVTGCGGTSFATAVVKVSANIISGNINFSGSPYVGPVTVWLITYDTATKLLEAVDSTIIYSTGATGYYQFLNEPSDSFRIKADVNDSLIVGLTGYMPTYHNSSFYWYAANVLNHTGGIDAGQDINMLTGIVTGGPGFVGGNVTLGANKGTTGGIPAVGLKMYCINGSTGTLIQQTVTDSNGNYNFSNLPAPGIYDIHAEAINYKSIDYNSIVLTPDVPGMTANFIQHTISLTITPVTIEAGVDNIQSATASVITYPNPTSGKLNIQWQEPASEKATITITDVTGREISKLIINMNQGSGSSSIDLSSLTNGLYMISIKSAAINYNSKIQVQK